MKRYDTPANLHNLMEKILLVPKKFRKFDAGLEIASKHYGINQDLLDDLIGLGLPFAQVGGRVLYATFDLSNISLYLGLHSVQRLAIRTWARTLQLSANNPTASAVVRVFPLGASTCAVKPLKVLTLSLENRKLFADGIAMDIINEWSMYQFYMLPEECRWDIGFIEKSRICECGGASKRMLFQAREMGIEARHCFGFLLSSPFSTAHYWTEFNLDGEWFAFDPLLLNLLRNIGGLDRLEWPIHRSSSATLHRLCVIDRYDVNGAPVLDQNMDHFEMSDVFAIMNKQVLNVSLPTEIILGQPA